MKLEITAHDLPETVSDLRIEVRLVDTSEADAPARNLADPFVTSVVIPEGPRPRCLAVAMPDPKIVPRQPACLHVRLTGQAAGGRKLLFLNTSEIIVPERPDQVIAVELFPAG